MVNEAKWRRVIRCVREIIADKSLQPGDELPTYRELMEICDASEATVARAIGRMQTAGIVRGVPGKRLYVGPRPHSEDL